MGNYNPYFTLDDERFFEESDADCGEARMFSHFSRDFALFVVKEAKLS